jgi:hypothetical protein
MTNHKRLSQISFAAIALVAALPCLAQTESNNHGNSMKTVQSNEIATLRRERLSAPRAELKMDKITAAEATSSAQEKFNKAIAQATASTSGFVSTPTISENDWQQTQRLADRAASTETKSITFVPSRGQKLPE